MGDSYKRCPKCTLMQPITAFHRNQRNSDGRSSWCRDCNLKSGADLRYRQRMLDPEGCKERSRIAAKASYHRNPERYRERARLQRARFKVQAFAHYGNVCACCGESDERFLTIDHIHGGGMAHRRTLGGKSLHQWLVENNFPTGFQTLCQNCNFAKGTQAYCVHNEYDWMRFVGSAC